MYYKVIRNAKVIDVLDKLTFVKYQIKHRVLLLCDESEAQGVLSSDGKDAYHLNTLNKFPVDNFRSATLEEIDRIEYEQLKNMKLKTVEEVTEAVLLELMERGVI